MTARVINCAECGALIVARAQRKYCIACGKQRDRERARERWRARWTDPAFRRWDQERHAARWATDADFRERKREEDQARYAEQRAVLKRLGLTWRQAGKLGKAEVVAAYKRAMQPERIERALREALGIPHQQRRRAYE